MASFSFFKTKVTLVVGTLAGLALLSTGVATLEPNAITKTELGYAQPPPIASLIESCGNYFWFDQEKIHLTQGEIENGNGTIIPLVLKDESTEPLDESAFRYYELQEISEDTIPTKDQALATIFEHDGYVIWYSPGTGKDLIENLGEKIEEMPENVMLLPWLPDPEDEERNILPQARNFGYLSYTQVTQSCLYAQPDSFDNFIEFAETDPGRTQG